MLYFSNEGLCWELVEKLFIYGHSNNLILLCSMMFIEAVCDLRFQIMQQCMVSASMYKK
jgi:hypothetical protein